jgi:hypothetical protein
MFVVYLLSLNYRVQSYCVYLSQILYFFFVIKYTDGSFSFVQEICLAMMIAMGIHACMLEDWLPAPVPAT